MQGARCASSPARSRHYSNREEQCRSEGYYKESGLVDIRTGKGARGSPAPTPSELPLAQISTYSPVNLCVQSEPLFPRFGEICMIRRLCPESLHAAPSLQILSPRRFNFVLDFPLTFVRSHSASCAWAGLPIGAAPVRDGLFRLAWGGDSGRGTVQAGWVDPLPRRDSAKASL